MAACSSITPPIEEYTLARAAFEAARSAEADRLAPLVYDQARQKYERAEGLFRDRELEQAKIFFNQSRRSFEKAEDLARKKKASSGEVL